MQASKIKIFISYSSKDRQAAESVHQLLAAAGFDIWCDQTRLETDWSREIASALVDSDVLCLLWSEHSAQSKWVGHEWLTAWALEKRIIPCLFPAAPRLLEPLHNLHGVPFPSLEEGVKKFIDRVNGEASLTVKHDFTVLPGNSYIPFNHNPLFTGRHVDLLELYLNMIGNLNKIGINQVGLVGMGGVGKTQLAVEFSFRFSFRFKAIYWIQAADPDTWIREFVSIARDRLKLEVKGPDTPEADRQYIFALQKYFKNHPNTLLLMDNVVEPKTLNNDTYLFGITPLTLGCDLLFTTRKYFQVPGVLSQLVNVLSSDAAYDLLKSYRTPEITEEEVHAKSICNAVGYLPLAIALAGAYLHEYRDDISFGDYSHELAKNRLGALDIGNMSEEDLATRHVAAVKTTLQSQWEMLKDADARHLFKLTGQFPEAAVVPKARLGLLAGIKPGQSLLDQPLAKALNQLHALCLLERVESDASSTRLHPLVRDFSFSLIPEVELGPFRNAAANHLKDAYFDYLRLETEIQKRGPYQVIDDLLVGIDWWGIDGRPKQDLELLQEVLRLSSYILDDDPTQLAGQLIGRLIEQKSQKICALLAEIRRTKRGPWLRPLILSLIPPRTPLLHTLKGHTADVFAVAVTSDGKAISGALDKVLKVWDVESGRCLRTLEGHTDDVFAVAVTLDGKVVSGSRDKTLKVWDVESGKCLRTLEGHSSLVLAVAVAPDGRVVSGSYDNTLKVWDIESGNCLRTLEGHESKVNTVTVAPNGKVVSGSYDNTLKVWDIESGKCLCTLEGGKGSVNAVAVMPDGKIVSGFEYETIKVWDIESGKCLRTLKGHIWSINAIAITPDGRVVSGASDDTLKVWDIKSGKCLRTLEGHTKHVRSVAVTPDGKVVSGASDDTLKIWDIKSEMGLRTLEAREWPVNALATTPDGKVISGSGDLSGFMGATLKVWDIESGKCLRTFKDYESLVATVAVTSDGRVVSGSLDNTLKVWDIESGKCLRTLEGHTDSVLTVAVTSDGKVVSGSRGFSPTLKVWDIESGNCLRTLEGHKNSILTLALTLDGKVVSGAYDYTLKVWDLKRGKCLHTFDSQGVPIQALAITHDGKIVCGWGLSLKVLDIKTGRCLRTLEGHRGSVNAVAITLNGKVISGSDDKSVKVWNIEKGEELASFAVDNEITAVAIGLDGKTLIAGDGWGRLHFLRLEGFD